MRRTGAPLAPSDLLPEIRGEVLESRIARYGHNGLAAMSFLQEFQGGRNIGAGRESCKDPFLGCQPTRARNDFFISDLEIAVNRGALQKFQILHGVSAALDAMIRSYRGL